MDWIIAHWQEIVAVAGAIVIVARLIVKLTPTQADDAWLAKVLDVIGHIGLSMPDKTQGNGKTPPTVLLLLLLPLLVTGCMASATVREAEAFEGATWQAHLGNDQRIEQCWEAVFVATRQADIDYTMQKSIDFVKVAAKTPAEIEEGIKAVVAAREKAMADTQLIVAKMRTLVAMNQSEAAKAMRLRGAISDWMSAGMEMSAIPNIVNEAFGVVQSLGLKVTTPGIQTPAIQPEPTAVPVPK